MRKPSPRTTKASAFLSLALALVLATAIPSSCSDSDDIYPSLITDIVTGQTDSQGTLAWLLTDYGERLTLTNPQSGLDARSTYRLLAGYTLADASATLYTLASVSVLSDTTKLSDIDPTIIVSTWQTPLYINLHLRPTDDYGNHYDEYASIPLR